MFTEVVGYEGKWVDVDCSADEYEHNTPDDECRLCTVVVAEDGETEVSEHQRF